jgi:hypothetical protein
MQVCPAEIGVDQDDPVPETRHHGPEITGNEGLANAPFASPNGEDFRGRPRLWPKGSRFLLLRF